MTGNYDPRGIAENTVKRLAPLALAALLAGCAGPRFVPNPEAGIELRWPNGSASIDDARALAATRCAGRPAMLDQESIDRDETLARFFCGGPRVAQLSFSRAPPR